MGGGLSTDELALKRATGQAVKAAGGQEAAAMATVAGRSQLWRCMSGQSRDSVTVRDAVTIDAIGAQVEGHPFILRAYAGQLGFGIHRLPEARPSVGDWWAHCAALTGEAGEIVGKIGRAMADGAVCQRDVEASGLAADALQLIEIGAGLLAALDAVSGGREGA